MIGGFLANRFGEAAFLAPALLSALLAILALVMTIRNPESSSVASDHAPQPDAHPSAKPTVAL